MIPPKPGRFTPDRAPSFVEIKLEAFRTTTGGVWWLSRPRITPRLQLVHTNGARGEGSIESAINWGNAAPTGNTHPHYQVDRNRAAKLVPTDRRGIGNATNTGAQGAHGNVSDWSLVIETSDEGYPTPGEAGGFIGGQIEMIAQILAYESIVHGIPLLYPSEWWGPGTACHTEPFGYPYWSIYAGKVCPGYTKKQQMRTRVLPRAQEIYVAWTTPTSPPGDDDMATKILWRPHGYKNVFITDGVNSQAASEAMIKAQGLAGTPVTVDPHKPTLKSVLAHAGLDLDDLAPEPAET